MEGRAGDDPAGEPDSGDQTQYRCPPAARTHRIDARFDRTATGEHRADELLAEEQAVNDDCRDVQADEDENDVEPVLVQVGEPFGEVEADQIGQWAFVKAVLVDREQAETDLDRKGAERAAMSWLELPPTAWFGVAFAAAIPLLLTPEPVTQYTAPGVVVPAGAAMSPPSSMTLVQSVGVSRVQG